jgi:hypothetical protein
MGQGVIRMKRVLSGGALAGLVWLAGCAVDGKWSLTSVEPSAARRDFQYEVLTLEKDGSFYAEAREGTGETRTTSGTYRYEKGVLALREHDGEEHAYDASVSSDQMKLKRPWQDRQLVARFERKQ